jgi:hypothetical protein
MVHPIGYYTGYNSQSRTPGILDQIQEQWGSQLERMAYEQSAIRCV